MNLFVNKTYAESIRLLVENYSNRIALIFGDQKYTFRQIKNEVDKASRKLRAIGLNRGDKVAIWLPNQPEFLFTWLGAGQIGLTAVILNTRLRSEEVQYQLWQSDARAVIVPGDGAFRDFLGNIASLCPDIRDCAPGEKLGGEKVPTLEYVIALSQTDHEFDSVVQWDDIQVDEDTPLAYETDPNSAALIAYSSGTTALPKGAMLTHAIWRKAADHGERFNQTPDDKLYLCVPLFSILGTVNGVITFWTGGSTVVLDDRYEPEKMLATIERERCTVAYLLPLMIYKSVELPNFDDYDLSSLRTGILVTVDREVIMLAYEKLGMTGFFTSYGMTETSSACTRTYSTDPLEVRIKSHGKPLRDIEVRIADPDSNEELPRGTVGEIQVRGYNMMLGYYNKPEETKRAFTEQGWYKTGDAGEMYEDDSVLFLHRLSDGYKHKGFNVSSAEVEAVLVRHPDVKQAAVVGVPDRKVGEVGAAFVILNDETSIDEEAIIAFLNEHLASFKVPAHLFQTDEFPVTAGTEKVQKFKLREQALKRLEQAL